MNTSKLTLKLKAIELELPQVSHESGEFNSLRENNKQVLNNKY